MPISLMEQRKSGLLLHMTSLPSIYGIGDMGPGAFQFADFLAESGQRIWQILPLNPTDPAHGNSPYSSISAFGCNPLLISLELLVRQGFLEQKDLDSFPDFPEGYIDYNTIVPLKKQLFSRIHDNIRAQELPEDYQHFCSENIYWLHDFVLFVALKEHFQGRPWNEWPIEIRDRHPDSLQIMEERLGYRIEQEKILQYLFHKQWFSLKEYCLQKNIQILGDIPIYVNYDSADVWTHPALFKLDESKKPTVVSGVPPDYFSETGQLWGNPVYRWDVLREIGYDWWLQRLKHNLSLFDVVRIDHFRGLAAYWEISAKETTAINGKWIQGPGKDFLYTIRNHFPSLPIIAEDLGVITPDVTELMEHFNLPGMKLLVFAFGDDLSGNPYIPHNHIKNCLIYTGTHDNNTVKGWFEKEITPDVRKRIFQYFGREIETEEIHWEMVRLAMMSVANIAILPMQDILGLGSEARMNLPASANGNWQWQLLQEQLTPNLTAKLLEMTRLYGRL